MTRAEEDPAVEDVLGLWETSAGATVTVMSQRNTESMTDPDAYFAARFGSLDESSGVEVSHETATTQAGDNVLYVDVAPLAGESSEHQSYFFVLTAETIVEGVFTADHTPSAATRGEFQAVASTLQTN